jgi:hypothetical protein
VLASLDSDQLDRALSAVKAGVPATEAVRAELDAVGVSNGNQKAT